MAIIPVGYLFVARSVNRTQHIAALFTLALSLRSDNHAKTAFRRNLDKAMRTGLLIVAYSV